MAVVVTVVGGAAARCLAGRNGMAMVAEVEESMVTIRGGACVLMALLLCIRKMSRVHASVMPQTTDRSLGPGILQNRSLHSLAVQAISQPVQGRLSDRLGMS